MIENLTKIIEKSEKNRLGKRKAPKSINKTIKKMKKRKKWKEFHIISSKIPEFLYKV